MGFSCVCTGNLSVLRARRWLVGEVGCEAWVGGGACGRSAFVYLCVKGFA